MRPFDGQTLRRATEAAGTDVVLVEPYLAGHTSTTVAGDALADVPHRVLGLGVRRRELRRYGSVDEHLTAHGLDADPCGADRRSSERLGPTAPQSAPARAVPRVSRPSDGPAPGRRRATGAEPPCQESARMSRSSSPSSRAASRTLTQASRLVVGDRRICRAPPGRVRRPRSSFGQRTAMDVSSSGSVANIFPATRKVGMLQAIFSVVSGRERAVRRTSSASGMEGTVARYDIDRGRRVWSLPAPRPRWSMIEPAAIGSILTVIFFEHRLHVRVAPDASWVEADGASGAGVGTRHLRSAQVQGRAPCSRALPRGCSRSRSA